MKLKRFYACGLFLAILALLLAGCLPSENSHTPSPQQTEVNNNGQEHGNVNLILVTHVVDGDTFVIEGDERVRLIAPETAIFITQGLFIYEVSYSFLGIANSEEISRGDLT